MHLEFAGIHLQNPVLAASGTFGYGVEFEDIVSFKRIGGFVTKGISREPMAGNPAPRLLETPAGMMNSIGLQNIGVKAFLETKLPALRKYPRCKVIVNVFGSTVGDYVEVIRQLNDAEGIAAYELNASCPNTNHGGMAFGTDIVTLDELVFRSKQVATRPLIVKLSPNVTSIASMAKCAETAGADALSLVNTFVALSIDVETRRPRIANITGGLSGPAIKPIAVRMALPLPKTQSNFFSSEPLLSRSGPPATPTRAPSSASQRVWRAGVPVTISTKSATLQAHSNRRATTNTQPARCMRSSLAHRECRMTEASNTTAASSAEAQPES
jgi:dihydroorotate dehydrogenase (NAD+) catalytic subunit